MTKQIKPSEMGWEEEEKEYNQVLRKAYAQKEDVDAEKLLKGFRAKSTDPNGWDFLSSWTWNWIEKKLSQAHQRGYKEGIKDERERIARLGAVKLGIIKLTTK